MTSDRTDRHARLADIVDALKRREGKLSDMIAEAIPLCADELRPAELDVLQHYLNGFSDQIALDYYLHAPLKKYEPGYMPHRGMLGRQREGRLMVVHADGSESHVTHDLSKRRDYFINAPICKIEELAESAGDTATIELPYLTDYIGKEEGGTIVLTMDGPEVQEMIEGARRNLIALLELVLYPERRERLERNRD